MDYTIQGIIPFAIGFFASTILAAVIIAANRFWSAYSDGNVFMGCVWGVTSAIVLGIGVFISAPVHNPSGAVVGGIVLSIVITLWTLILTGVYDQNRPYRAPKPKPAPKAVPAPAPVLPNTPPAASLETDGRTRYLPGYEAPTEWRAAEKARN